MITFCLFGLVFHLACGVWVIWKMDTAPYGVEIPGIGFVELDDEPKND